jgi:disulfide bond formation protein DsbB
MHEASGPERSDATSATDTGSAGNVWPWTALLVALAAVAGSLYLSIGLRLQACPLCFYQRTFAMAVVGVLLIGLLSRAEGSLVSLLALPSAVGGAGVAAFHVYLEQTGKLECPHGLFDLGTAPTQSLATFVLLLLPLAADAFRSRPVCGLGAVLLGALLAYGALSGNPPPTRPAPAEYDHAPITCRPPQHAPNNPTGTPPVGGERKERPGSRRGAN